jgi:uncharacterized protein (DUF433 family)
MNVKDVLSSNPEIVSGAVVFKGTRVPVSALFENLAAGLSLTEVLENFPSVDRQQAEAALLLAAENFERQFA